MGHAAVLEERHLAASSARVRLRDAALHALAEAEDAAAVEQAWQRIEEHFEDLFTEPEDIAPLRQAVLQLAVHGRLLASDHRRDWVAVTLANVLAEDLANGWSPKTVAYETSLRSLKLSATTSGVFRPCQFKYIDATLPAESGYWLRDGDLLIQRSNTPELVGVSAVYRGAANQFIYPDLMIRCRLAPERALPEFVHLALRDLYARGYFRERASGTSGSMVKINQPTLGATPIVLPPLAEQHRIVAKVDELMALCDTLEASLTRAKAAREQFAASISAAIDDTPTPN